MVSALHYKSDIVSRKPEPKPVIDARSLIPPGSRTKSNSEVLFAVLDRLSMSNKLDGDKQYIAEQLCLTRYLHESGALFMF